MVGPRLAISNKEREERGNILPVCFKSLSLAPHIYHVPQSDKGSPHPPPLQLLVSFHRIRAHQILQLSVVTFWFKPESLSFPTGGCFTGNPRYTFIPEPFIPFSPMIKLHLLSEPSLRTKLTSQHIHLETHKIITYPCCCRFLRFHTSTSRPAPCLAAISANYMSISANWAPLATRSLPVKISVAPSRRTPIRSPLQSTASTQTLLNRTHWLKSFNHKTPDYYRTKSITSTPNLKLTDPHWIYD